MSWSDQLTRIRRWVRDPDANIFDEAFLRRLFNDEMENFYSRLGTISDVTGVLIHPSFDMSYHQDWEYAHCGSEEVYKIGDYYDLTGMSYQHIWEPESLRGRDATSLSSGHFYTHPWEAWTVTDIYHPPPIPLPPEWSEMIFMAFDRCEVTPLSKTEVMQLDTTWRTNRGTPYNYWRDSERTNWVYIYPLPTIIWQDGYPQYADPDTAEYTSGGYALTFGDSPIYFGSTILTFGPNVDSINTDNNLLVIYRKQPEEIINLTDEIDLPAWMIKYVEYGVAARALRANTDGRIESLADYWEIRKKAGYEIVDRYKRMKMTSRALGLKTSKGISYDGDRPKYPRLPSTYNDVWT